MQCKHSLMTSRTDAQMKELSEVVVEQGELNLPKPRLLPSRPPPAVRPRRLKHQSARARYGDTTGEKHCTGWCTFALLFA